MSAPRFGAGTVNLWHMPRDRFAADVREVAGLELDVVAWQEANRDAEHDAIRRGMGDDFRHLFPNTPNPISLHRRHAVAARGVLWAHDAVPGVTPARCSTWALVDPYGCERCSLVVLNTHRIHRAWRDDRPTELRESRRNMWRIHEALDRGAVAGWAGVGLSALLLGDYNRTTRDLSTYTPGHRWLATGGVDQVGIVDPDQGTTPPTIRFVGLGRRALNSDHDARTATLEVCRHAHPRKSVKDS